MTEPSKSAMDAAFKCAETVLRNLPDDYGDVSQEVRCIALAIDAATKAEREANLAACEAQKASFQSTEYATPQPLGSLMECFAVDMCIAAIRKRGEG